MTKDDKPTPQPDPTREEKGYQPRPLTEGYQPVALGGYQGTSGRRVPVSPPPNPPNKDTAGKK